MNGDSAAGTNASGSATIAWHEGRSLSYRSSTPYSPFVNLLSDYFGLRTEESDEEKYEKVRSGTEHLKPGRVEESAPFLATVMGIELTGEGAERVKYLSPPQVRDRVFNTICDFFERLAAIRPLVLVFEDLHWTDPTSLDLIEHLMACTDRASLAIVALFRPQRQEPSWRFHETAARDCNHRYTSITLDPLDEDSSRSLVANLLHIEDLPESVRGLILTKAEGNPFYVEEVIRSLLDAQLVVWEDSHWRATREIESIAVPDTLAGVINARLDRLEPQPRRVAQTASVIGREFDFDTLADVHETIQQLDGSLAELQRRELVREKSQPPERVYIYKHALTQETVYATLLLSTRRTLHRRVAECLLQMEPDRVGEIARHFVEAREHELALPHLIDAGDRAARTYSSNEAIRFFTQALEILETVEDAQLGRRAYEGLGGALTFARDVPGAVENYHAMFHAGQRHGDLPMQVSAMNKLGFVTALMQGQFPEAEEHLAEAERLANECEDLSGLAELHMTYCYLRVPIGEF